MREQGPAHGLRGGGLPEHRRVLGAEARDGDDPGRHLHPRLRLLQRQDRACRWRSTRTSRRIWPRSWPSMGLAHVVITSVDRDDLPDGGAFQFVRCIEAIRAAAPGDHDRDPDPRLPAQARRGRGDRRGAARRLQPQSRDRAAPLPRRCGPARATSTRCACCSRSRSSTRAMFTKSGIMVGLGEEKREVLQVMDDMRSADDRFPDHRPVSAADAAPPPGRALRRARRVRGLRPHGPRQGLPAWSRPRR